MLWLAVLLYGAHAGASLYEMLVVTPQWAAEQPQSLRQWSRVANAAIRPLAYKEPAALALGTVSIVILWFSMWRVPARGWMVSSGVLGLALVAATVLFAFPLLERALRASERSLTDQQLALDAQAWQLWCKLRLVLLVAAWAASLVALVRTSLRQTGQWHPTSIRL